MGIFNIFKKKPTSPFREPLNTATFCCKCIINGDKEISYASHDADGEWTFLCKDCCEQFEIRNLMIVGLKTVLSKHPEIKKFANLDYGLSTIYDEKNDDWKIMPIEEY